MKILIILTNLFKTIKKEKIQKIIKIQKTNLNKSIY
jgi:hypothetical protein